jgi:hypothetical protein
VLPIRQDKTQLLINSILKLGALQHISTNALLSKVIRWYKGRAVYSSLYVFNGLIFKMSQQVSKVHETCKSLSA